MLIDESIARVNLRLIANYSFHRQLKWARRSKADFPDTTTCGQRLLRSEPRRPRRCEYQIQSSNAEEQTEHPERPGASDARYPMEIHGGIAAPQIFTE